MLKEILSAKIHRAAVTAASLDYEGSLAIDENWMDMVGMAAFEKVLVGNINNGNRFETYAIPAPRDSKTISLNGAVAHLGKIGDRVVIMSFNYMDAQTLAKHEPRVIVLNEKNDIINERGI